MAHNDIKQFYNNHSILNTFKNKNVVITVNPTELLSYNKKFKTFTITAEINSITYKNRIYNIAKNTLVYCNIKRKYKNIDFTTLPNEKLLLKGNISDYSKANISSDFKEYLFKKQIPIIFNGIIIQHETNYNMSIIITTLKKHLLKKINIYIPDRERELLKSILFGNDTFLNKELKEAFIGSGTIHLLVVSGFHIGIIWFIFLSLTQLIFGNKKILHFLPLTTVFIFVLLTGSKPPAIRAFLFLTLITFGNLIYRKINYVNILGCIFVILFFIDRTNIFNPGVYLSIFSTAGILLFANKIKDLFIFFPQKIADIMVASISAQFMIFPLLVYFFNFFSIYSLLLNVILIPLIFFIFILYGLIFLLPFIEEYIFYLLSQILLLIQRIVIFTKTLPFISVNISNYWILVWLCIITFIILRKITNRKYSSIIPVTCLILLIIYRLFFYTYSISFINSTGNNTILFHKRYSKNIIINPNLSNKKETAGLIERLRKKDINIIDYMVITHNKWDYTLFKYIHNFFFIKYLYTPSKVSIYNTTETVFLKYKRGNNLINKWFIIKKENDNNYKFLINFYDNTYKIYFINKSFFMTNKSNTCFTNDLNMFNNKTINKIYDVTKKNFIQMKAF